MAGVRLKFVTPIWTGDASRSARRVVGTGLAGSLRWWYEALIRGLGGWACDPANDRIRCPPRGATVTADSVTRLLCPACQIFGATGWAKAFYMDVEGKTVLDYPPTGRDSATATNPDCRNSRINRLPTFYFPRGLIGTVALNLRPRRPNDEKTVSLPLGLLDFIRRNAALGAKTNLGYGLFDWEEDRPPKDLPSAEGFAKMVADRAAVGRQGDAGRWPDLREMFFAEVDLESPWKPEDFANFKCGLRAAFREGEAISGIVPEEYNRRQLRHFLLGTTEDDPHQGSKIKMALFPACQRLRVWGWVPKDMAREVRAGVSRDAVVKLFKQYVGSCRTITRWREYNSSRDSTKKTFRTPEAYLQSLMED